MTLAIPGVPSDYKVPGFYINLAFGMSPTGAGGSARKALIYANKTAALSGSTPAFTSAAGTQAVSTPIEVFDPDIAAALAGRGSEGHRMVKAFFDQAPGTSVHLVLVEEATGDRASAVVAFTGTASAAFTVRLLSCGEVIEATISSGDTAAEIADALADAVLASQDLPFTAQTSTDPYGVDSCVFTARQKGTRGNNLSFQLFFVNDTTGLTTQITNTSTSSGSTTTAQLEAIGGDTLTAIGANLEIFTFEGGTGTDSLTAALAAVSNTLYDGQACAHRSSTQLDAIMTQLYSMSAPLVGKHQQLVAATTDSLATANALATGRNRELCQLVCCPFSPTPASEIAAQQLALRMHGDAAAGGHVVGENTDPSCNLIGGLHATTQAPAGEVDRLSASQQNSALSNGVTPLVASGIGNGVKCVRSITTKCLKNGQPFYSTLDTKTVTVPQFVAKDLPLWLATTFPAFKLGSDLSDGTPPRQSGVTSIRGVYDVLKARLLDYEQGNAGLPSMTVNTVSNCGTFGSPTAGLVVQAGAQAGTLTAYIPCEPVPDFIGLSAQLNQL